MYQAVPLFEPICIEIRCVPYHFFSGNSAVPYHLQILGYGPAFISTYNIENWISLDPPPLKNLCSMWMIP